MALKARGLHSVPNPIAQDSCLEQMWWFCSLRSCRVGRSYKLRKCTAWRSWFNISFNILCLDVMIHICCKFEKFAWNTWHNVIWTAQLTKIINKNSSKVIESEDETTLIWYDSKEYENFLCWCKFVDSSSNHRVTKQSTWNMVLCTYEWTIELTNRRTWKRYSDQTKRYCCALALEFSFINTTPLLWMPSMCNVH